MNTKQREEYAEAFAAFERWAGREPEDDEYIDLCPRGTKFYCAAISRGGLDRRAARRLVRGGLRIIAEDDVFQG